MDDKNRKEAKFSSFTVGTFRNDIQKWLYTNEPQKVWNYVSNQTPQKDIVQSETTTSI